MQPCLGAFHTDLWRDLDVTPPNQNGVDTAASARRNLGHAVDVYEVWQGLLPFLRRFTMLRSSALSQRVQGRTCEVAA